MSPLYLVPLPDAEIISNVMQGLIVLLFDINSSLCALSRIIDLKVPIGLFVAN